jgi:hypothetical protein
MGTLQYRGTDPTQRSAIPRQKPSMKLARLLNINNNTILPAVLMQIRAFHEINLSIYCAAVTAVGQRSVQDMHLINRAGVTYPCGTGGWKQR